jgi:hypothetical protein
MCVSTGLSSCHLCVRIPKQVKGKVIPVQAVKAYSIGTCQKEKRPPPPMRRVCPIADES